MTTTIIPSESLATTINQKKNKKGANFTVRAKKSGKEFTYKISRSEYNGRWYTHISVEQNYLEFKYLGHYHDGMVTRKGKIVDTPSAKGIAWILHRVEDGKSAFVDEHYEVMHTGCCLSCGRELTDSTSIEIGLGPVCRNK